jgi:hypothetical protein
VCEHEGRSRTAQILLVVFERSGSLGPKMFIEHANVRVGSKADVMLFDNVVGERD